MDLSIGLKTGAVKRIARPAGHDPDAAPSRRVAGRASREEKSAEKVGNFLTQCRKRMTIHLKMGMVCLRSILARDRFPCCYVGWANV